MSVNAKLQHHSPYKAILVIGSWSQWRKVMFDKSSDHVQSCSMPYIGVKSLVNIIRSFAKFDSLILSPRPTGHWGAIESPLAFFLTSAKPMAVYLPTWNFQYLWWHLFYTLCANKISHLRSVDRKWHQRDVMSGRFWCKIRVYKNHSPECSF